MQFSCKSIAILGHLSVQLSTGADLHMTLHRERRCLGKHLAARYRRKEAIEEPSGGIIRLAASARRRREGELGELMLFNDSEMKLSSTWKRRVHPPQQTSTRINRPEFHEEQQTSRPSNCTETALNPFQSCPENAPKLWWNCPKVALKLHWNYTEIAPKLP